MTKLHTYIISWKGMHEKAANIAKEVKSASDQTTVVYSEPLIGFAPDFPCRSVSRPNHLFWGDKFETCIRDCNSEIMLVIHADCTCDNWARLVRSCKKSMKKRRKIGVWAPLISGTRLNVSYNQISAVAGTKLLKVAFTDGIVFGLSKPIIDRMCKLDYSENVLGWGIDVFFNIFAYSKGMDSVVDGSIAVDHPLNRGYSSDEAWIQARRFLRQMSPSETAAYRELRHYVLQNERRLGAEISKQLRR